MQYGFFHFPFFSLDIFEQIMDNNSKASSRGIDIKLKEGKTECLIF